MSPLSPLVARSAVLTVCLSFVLAPVAAVAAPLEDPEVEAVEAVLERRDAPPEQRHEAAVRLVELEGGKAADLVFDVALEATTSYELQCLLADILAGMPSERFSDKVQGEVRKVVGDERAPVTDRLFALRAITPPEDARAARTLIDAFEDEDALVRQAALDAAVRLELDYVPDVLRELLDDTREEDPVRPVGGAWLAALDGLQGRGAAFVDELFGYTESRLLSARTTAARRLAARLATDESASDDGGDDAPRDELRLTEGGAPDAAGRAELLADPRLDPLLERLLMAEPWSERLAGVALARQLPQLRSVPALIEHFPYQTGRLFEEFDAALMALTRQDLRSDPERWESWWVNTGRPALKAPEPEEDEPFRRRSRLGERDRSRARQRPEPARFFDLEVASNAVVFVVDISGSMDWPASYESDDRRNVPVLQEGEASRMDLAREQIAAAVQGMDEQTRYNIIPFNDRARPWLTREGMAEFGKAGKRKEDALEFLEELSPNGGTNVYGALRAAFDDPQVDTIYLLSDGVPSMGDFTVPELIQRSVRAWNGHRHVKLHSIVMGLDVEKHPLARDLAKAWGGQFVTLP